MCKFIIEYQFKSLYDSLDKIMCIKSITYLIKYWHIGSSKKANATVAMTAVQMANNICIESKKKNMTSNDTEAPNGKHIACNESKVWIPDELALPDSSLSLVSSKFLSSSKAKLL